MTLINDTMLLWLPTQGFEAAAPKAGGTFPWIVLELYNSLGLSTNLITCMADYRPI